MLSNDPHVLGNGPNGLGNGQWTSFVNSIHESGYAFNGEVRLGRLFILALWG